jgi:hypothetical protein
VNELLPTRAEPLPWYLRTVLAIAGAGALGLLLTAGLLKPSPDGFGTHRQLGLPPCSFTMWFGKRCPSCGMTTSWAHLTKGRVLDSLAANAGGTLLALSAAMVGPWALWSGLRGKWLLGPPNEKIVLVAACSVLGVTLLDWCFRLYTG